jgi:NAD(P)-dependent dehydrogenase (short-subunit alcohol dehydrogenase family)
VLPQPVASDRPAGWRLAARDTVASANGGLDVVLPGYGAAGPGLVCAVRDHSANHGGPGPGLVSVQYQQPSPSSASFGLSSPRRCPPRKRRRRDPGRRRRAGDPRHHATRARPGTSSTRRLRSAHRPLRALVNNAGISVNAPVEAPQLGEWRRLYDVNLFGHIAVTQALLPFLHRSHGRIVNISSVAGKVAMATYGPYAGTKFALEAISDSLRRELAPHGVQVVVVEPGAVKTEMADRGAATATDLAERMNPGHRQRYGRLVKAVVAHSLAFTRNGMTADKAGSIVTRAATTRRPRTRYAVGRDAAA